LQKYEILKVTISDLNAKINIFGNPITIVITGMVSTRSLVKPLEGECQFRERPSCDQYM
jgi:hypothetical protein